MAPRIVNGFGCVYLLHLHSLPPPRAGACARRVSGSSVVLANKTNEHTNDTVILAPRGREGEGEVGRRRLLL